MTFNVVPGSLSFSFFAEVSGQYHLMLGGTCHRVSVSRLTCGGPVVAACAVIVVFHLHLHSFSPPLSLHVLSEAPLLYLPLLPLKCRHIIAKVLSLALFSPGSCSVDDLFSVVSTYTYLTSDPQISEALSSF